MGEFLDHLKQLLDNTEYIAKDEVKEADRLIKERRWELSLRREGPCLVCQEIMQYGHPCAMQTKEGDDWLDSLFAKWERGSPTFGKRYGRNLTINGYGWTTIEPYICMPCQDRLKELISDFEAQEYQKAVRQQEKDREYEHALITGEVRGTLIQRFRALQSHISDRNIEQLREMPYQEFLGTVYWDIVRGYVLWKRKYKCELCNGNGKLNVHHRSYDHRGKEYNYLEDLIVLCQGCHAKFHDKLAT